MKLCMAPLFSSSSGNSILIGSEKTNLLVDAGMPGSKIKDALEEIQKDPAEICGIVITHEHSDHIKGVGILSRKYDIPVYANQATWEQMEEKVGRIAQKNIRVFDRGDFYIGDIGIQPFSISHDAADPVGFGFYANGKKMAILTDTGKATKEMISRVKGSSIVLLESNHDIEMLQCGTYPYQLKRRILSSKGHLSNADAGKAAVEIVEAGVRGILLGHLSRQNNFEELAYRTVCDTLLREGIRPGKDVAIGVTKKDCVTGVYEV